MKEYYIINNRVKFYCSNLKLSSRNISYRNRYSYIYDKHATCRLPFRVSNYFAPTMFYNGILSKEVRSIDCGYHKVKRGIGRNKNVAK